MTQFNVLVLEQESRVMTDTLGITRSGEKSTIRKTNDLPGAVLTGRGGDSFFRRLTELTWQHGYSGFDAIAEDLSDLAWEALVPRLEEIRGLLGTTASLEKVARQGQALLQQGEFAVSWTLDHQLIVTGYSEREGKMLGAITGFLEHPKVMIVRPPNIAGGQQEVLNRAFHSIPTVEQQAEGLRLQYQADIQYAKDRGFPIDDPAHVGGGDIELTRITPDGTIAREIIGPLIQPQRRQAKIGRNDPCPCGSGRKYKKCCIDRRAAA